ncbi:MAG: M23 family metallopeptidase [Armatimonadota bacterium]|nr:M23 family metallopeptidase [Armatimonadota bacterium]MDR7484090.1 M23 family metallopeptidase [Armatimonadota bacterium]MDR7519330.1 M23 family metallopeptidase [Armatimonadota bacterium]MDR7550801.1 M23 family metallopeptidase [Armatimonadota bacterium]
MRTCTPSAALVVAGALVVAAAGRPVAPAGAAASGPAVVLQVSRSSLRQGEAIRVTIETAAPASRPAVRFAGRSWAAYPAGGTTWRTILGTDPMTAAGRHTIAVAVVTAAGARVTAARQVTVTWVDFPRRRITFDPKQAALLTRENVEIERRKVREALRALHPQPLWQDPLLLPVRGPVSSGYGVLSVYQAQVRGFHGGVDFAVEAGTPVRAAADGIVRLAEPLPLSGNAILIDHGLGVISSYLHLSQIGVRPGQRVAKGEVIGRVGSTGLATGPHLHWGLRVNGVRVDPLPWTVQ